ncbi:MAG TPA: hypothetical protein VFX97_07300 [Pyrinomonadaceae bacterium]|nr:hypothetical protein [Pyrinomonadaceae bacterium]
MLGILLLAGSWLTGFAIVRRLASEHFSLPQQILSGLVIGWVLSVALTYLAARAIGRLSFSLIIAATVVGWFVALALSFTKIRSLRTHFERGFSWRREHTGLAFVLVVLAPIFWKVFSAQMFARDVDGVYSGGSSLYDLSFHAAIASSFAYGENFPPVYPLLPPEPLLYPPLPDFHAAMLMAAGWGIRAAFIVTAIPLALAIAGLFYFFALRLAQSVRAAVIATFLLLFNGGLGFIYFFRDWRASGHGLFAALSHPADNYCNSPAHGLHWVNIIADMLAPQRTSLYALPLALIVLTTLAIIWQRLAENKSNEPKSRTIVLLSATGLLAGAIAYVQPHILIAVAIVALALFALKPRRIWFAFFVPAILMGLPFLITAVRHATGGGFLRFQPGWLGRDEPIQIIYWLRNLGAPLLLLFFAYFTAPLHWRRFYLAFAGLMLVTVLFVLSPNDYDNLKLMYVWYAPTCVLIGMWLARLSRKRWLAPLVAITLVVSMASGVLAVRRGMIEREMMFTAEQAQAAAYVREHTAPRALFLAAPTFHQPVLSLAGRPVVRGVTDWLWSHGYNFQDREADVRRIYAGAEDAAELLRYYRIDYVYLGDAERADMKADSAFFDRHFSVFYRSRSITIYDTRSAFQSSPAFTRPEPRELASRIDKDPYALLIEFPRTSFFVYRLYKTSYARLPRRDEFMAAMKKLGQGVFVGSPNGESQLSANQTSLLNEWMQGAEFKTLYESRSNAEFVDMLLRNTNEQLGGAARDQLVNRLDSGADTRASVLLRFIEDERFRTREYNSAYVLAHFFGYLGRNPGDPPDKDLSGFNYWLSVLDRTGDRRSLSRAFLESSEYKSRPVN